jgi:hypothetical protein
MLPSEIEALMTRNPELRRLNQELIDKLNKHISVEAGEHYDGSEAELQAEAEKYLEQRGFLRMTANNLAKTRKSDPCRGWFAHWPQARGNPICADLLIFDFPISRVPLWVEFKVRNKWQRGQKDAVTLRVWHVCWNMADFTKLFGIWYGGETGQGGGIGQ